MNFIIILHSEYVKSRSGEGVGICQGELGHCGQVAYVVEGLAGQPRHFEGPSGSWALGVRRRVWVAYSVDGPLRHSMASCMALRVSCGVVEGPWPSSRVRCGILGIVSSVEGLLGCFGRHPQVAYVVEGPVGRSTASRVHWVLWASCTDRVRRRGSVAAFWASCLASRVCWDVSGVIDGSRTLSRVHWVLWASCTDRVRR